MSESLSSLRRQLLSGDGILPRPQDPPRRKNSDWAEEVEQDKDNKTLAMRMLEAHFGEKIESLLSMDQKGADVGRKLGIHESTVSVWRKRLGLF